MSPFKSRSVAVDLWEPPDWGADGSKTPEGLETLRKYVEQQAGEEILWYARSSRRARRGSRVVRVIAILFTALGGAMPAISGMKWLVWPAKETLMLMGVAVTIDETQLHLALGQLGYVFLALAGSALLFDKFFGFSTAWMRSVASMIALKKMREAFRIEWVSLARQLVLAKASSDGGPSQPSLDPAARMFELGKLYLAQVKDQSEKETAAWSLEFQSNLSQFEKDLRTQMEAGRPGGIDVEVLDGDRAVDGFDLVIDQMTVEHVTGSSGSIGFVPPGLHKIGVSARVGSKTYVSSQMVNVVAASVVKTQTRLGIPAQSSFPPPDAAAAHAAVGLHPHGNGAARSDAVGEGTIGP